MNHLRFITELSDLSKKDADTAGTKGAFLGEMLQFGYPVPEGFVLLTTAFETFLTAKNLRSKINKAISSVSIDNSSAVNRISAKVRGMIIKSSVPKEVRKAILAAFSALGESRVAVRSSANAEDSAFAAWPGQLDSFLNTKEKDLLTNVKKCWASLFTTRAIVYRIKMGMSKQEISIGVIIQKMIMGEKSGVAFSIHPVTLSKTELLIEAGFGLGESTMTGRITPDQYIVRKKSGRLLTRRVSDKKGEIYSYYAGGTKWRALSKKSRTSQVLSNTEIRKLANLSIRLENLFGFACDIEWAKKGRQFFLLQCRPISKILTKKSISQIVSDLSARKKWIYYLARSFNLFGASLWHLWYSAPQTKRLFGADMQDVIMIEHNRRIVRQYRVKEQIDRFTNAVTTLVQNDRRKCLRILRRAEILNEDAQKYIEKGSVSFNNLRKAINFSVDLGLKATIFPFLAYPIMTGLKNQDRKFQARLERLRKVSYYSEFVNSVILPLAAIELKKNGFSVSKGINLVTATELMKGKLGNLKHRLDNREKPRRFVYICSRGKETVEWIDNVDSLIFKMENLDLHHLPTIHERLTGEATFRGKAIGVARLVLSPNQKNVRFYDGDILVCIYSTPAMMNFMRKSSAILADEGGIASHAAIISRELGKPCLVGTRLGTLLIKDGDIVEVDATHGVARILDRRKSISN